MINQSQNNALVTAHYNTRENENRESRKSSRIYQMRQFNNWLKDVLIRLHTRPGYSVLDLCCGKGGDLHKFISAKVASYAACDTADVSVKEAADRYNNTNKASFKPLLLVGDCFQVRISEFLPESLTFDVVSCQFAIHYAFENETRVRRLLQNVTDRLQPGGFFIGTTVDANVLLRKIRAIDGLEIGSEVYQVSFDKSFTNKKIEKGVKNHPYGVKYNFTLDNRVDDCPEFLVHFPTFAKLAEEYDLELQLLCNFHDFYSEFTKDEYPEYRDLFYRRNSGNEHGRISADEWDAIYLYTAFAFKKRGEVNPGIRPDEVSQRPTQYVAEDEIITMR